MEINFKAFIAKFDEFLSRGLSHGMGERDGQMCIEAAVCAALGLPHGDDPQCVAQSVRAFKITLNDSFTWSSPQARAKGLRDLGIAQVGSKGVINDEEFRTRLATETIKIIIPKLFRMVLKGHQYTEMIAHKCEQEGSAGSADQARVMAYDVYLRAVAEGNRTWINITDSASSAAQHAVHAWSTASYSARTASHSANAAGLHAGDPRVCDEFMMLSASIALSILKDMKSPGAAYV